MYMAGIHNRCLCYHIYDTGTDRDNPHDFGRMLLGNPKCSRRNRSGRLVLGSYNRNWKEDTPNHSNKSPVGQVQ